MYLSAMEQGDVSLVRRTGDKGSLVQCAGFLKRGDELLIFGYNLDDMSRVTLVIHDIPMCVVHENRGDWGVLQTFNSLNYQRSTTEACVSYTMSIDTYRRMSSLPGILDFEKHPEDDMFILRSAFGIRSGLDILRVPRLAKDDTIIHLNSTSLSVADHDVAISTRKHILYNEELATVYMDLEFCSSSIDSRQCEVFALGLCVTKGSARYDVVYHTTRSVTTDDVYYNNELELLSAVIDKLKSVRFDVFVARHSEVMEVLYYSCSAHGLKDRLLDCFVFTLGVCHPTMSFNSGVVTVQCPGILFIDLDVLPNELLEGDRICSMSIKTSVVRHGATEETDTQLQILRGSIESMRCFATKKNHVTHFRLMCETMGSNYIYQNHSTLSIRRQRCVDTVTYYTMRQRNCLSVDTSILLPSTLKDKSYGGAVSATSPAMRSELVLYMDASSYYTSIMIAFNIDENTLIDPEKVSSEDFYYMLRVSLENDSIYDTGSGVLCFQHQKHGVGPTPLCTQKHVEKKKRLKERIRLQGGDQGLDALVWVEKMCGTLYYGCKGPVVQNAVTTFGRSTMRDMRRRVPEEVVSQLHAKAHLVGGDTDSCGISFAVNWSNCQYTDDDMLSKLTSLSATTSDIEILLKEKMDTVFKTAIEGVLVGNGADRDRYVQECLSHFTMTLEKSCLISITHTQMKRNALLCFTVGQGVSGIHVKLTGYQRKNCSNTERLFMDMMVDVMFRGVRILRYQSAAGQPWRYVAAVEGFEFHSAFVDTDKGFVKVESFTTTDEYTKCGIPVRKCAIRCENNIITYSVFECKDGKYCLDIISDRNVLHQRKARLLVVYADMIDYMRRVLLNPIYYLSYETPSNDAVHVMSSYRIKKEMCVSVRRTRSTCHVPAYLGISRDEKLDVNSILSRANFYINAAFHSHACVLCNKSVYDDKEYVVTFKMLNGTEITFACVRHLDCLVSHEHCNCCDVCILYKSDEYSHMQGSWRQVESLFYDKYGENLTSFLWDSPSVSQIAVTTSSVIETNTNLIKLKSSYYPSSTPVVPALDMDCVWGYMANTPYTVLGQHKTGHFLLCHGGDDLWLVSDVVNYHTMAFCLISRWWHSTRQRKMPPVSYVGSSLDMDKDDIPNYVSRFNNAIFKRILPPFIKYDPKMGPIIPTRSTLESIPLLCIKDAPTCSSCNGLDVELLRCRQHGNRCTSCCCSCKYKEFGDDYVLDYSKLDFSIYYERNTAIFGNYIRLKKQFRLLSVH